MSNNNEPQLRDSHAGDKFGAKLVDKTEHWQKKADKFTHQDEEKKGPAGGFDDAKVPNAPPGYTLRITFHRAENLPFSDFPSFSTDAYIHATFKTDLLKRHKQDPDLFLRTPTIHRNVNPVWETQWILAHVPASGFFLKCRLYDEDPADHDDRLGNIHVRGGPISDSWPGIKNQPYELKKRMGSKRAYTFRGAAALLRKGIKMSGRVFISVENLGRSPGESGGRCYTVGPLPWMRHHSPLIGRIAGTKDRENSKDGKSVERYNFQAIQMQLRGPVPAEMYHRYVEFRPFIAGMFTDHSVRGRILNRALHHQHARIYNYDTSTVYGIFEKPCIEMTKQFLEFVHYDQGGRIYTYVLSLDGLWRFTETGKEFGIDMLSKHTMHSDVSIYIAFSGEFFIRRLKHPHLPHKQGESTPDGNLPDELASPDASHENEHSEKGGHSHNALPKDPSNYELIIDNDSGTYRPNAALLPLLRDYMAQNLPGLKVATLDCQQDEELMKKLKAEQVERRKSSGKQITYMQNSSMSSLSSSDEEKLEARAAGEAPQHSWQKKLGKISSHKQRDGQVADSAPKRRPNVNRDREAIEGGESSGRDSRDLTSSTSSQERAIGPGPIDEQNREQHHGQNREQDASERKASGYDNKELPVLLKKDTNGDIPRPPEESPTKQQDNVYATPETGENRPAGGIVYGKVMSTAGEEKGRGGC